MNQKTSNDDHTSDDHSSSSEKIDVVPTHHDDNGISTDVERTPDQTIPAPVKVPRSERRGLFGRFTVVAEVTQPKDYPRSIKYLITVLVAFTGMAAPMGSTIIFPSLKEISHAFNTTPTITNFSASFYMLSMAIFPLWWSSFSETFGRRSIYVISFTLWVVWNILAAVSVNITMFIIMRILSGGAAASVQAVGAGTIADVWHVRERGKAMGLFYLGPLMGPFLAPIIGGALAQGLGWRSTLWFLVIYGGLTLILLTFCLPETLTTASRSETKEQKSRSANQVDNSLSRTVSMQSVSQKTSLWASRAKRYLLDPLKIILYLRYPAVLITVYYASITFGSLYLLNISLETSFSAPPYSFSALIVGLTYVPNSIGYILASIFGGRWTDFIMAREARRAGRFDENGNLQYIPEDRMRENAWMAAIMYPIALIWYGWSIEKGTHWIVPLIAGFFFGVGSMLVFAMATTMLTEFMPKRASHGVAVNNFVRNICSFIGAIVAEPLIRAIGNGWLFTGVGIIAGCSSIVIWMMRRFGPRWRERMVKELG